MDTSQNLTADQLAAQARIAAHMARLAANKTATTAAPVITVCHYCGQRIGRSGYCTECV